MLDIQDYLQRLSITKQLQKMIPDQIKQIQVKQGKKIINVLKKIASEDFSFKLSTIQDQNYDLLWTDYPINQDNFLRIKNYQKINYIPGIEQICRKNYLNKNLCIMMKEFPNEYNFFPRTWNLPADLHQLRMFVEKKPKTSFILKPGNNCQGKGIQVFQQITDFEQIEREDCVIQQYINNPFLIDDLKWDLRIYVLVISIEPFRVYIYKEGMARFATEKYAPISKFFYNVRKNKKNSFQHLTNYAINKNNPNYRDANFDDTNSQGHKRSLTFIMEHLASMVIFSFQEHDTEALWKSIKEIVIKSLIPVQTQIKHQCQRFYFDKSFQNRLPFFHILGFDIMIDSKLKPWLIEINASPSYNQDTNFDQKMKSSLIIDTFNLLNIGCKKARDEYRQQQIDEKYSQLYKKNKKQTKEEKNMLLENLQKKEDEYIEQNLGKYEPIHNVLEPQMFEKLIEYQNIVYQKSIGLISQMPNQENAKNQKNDSSKDNQNGIQKIKRRKSLNSIELQKLDDNIKNQEENNKNQEENTKTPQKINFVKRNTIITPGKHLFKISTIVQQKRMKDQLQVQQENENELQSQSQENFRLSLHNLRKQQLEQKQKTFLKYDKRHEDIQKIMTEYQKNITKYTTMSIEQGDTIKIFKYFIERDRQKQSSLLNIQNYTDLNRTRNVTSMKPYSLEVRLKNTAEYMKLIDSRQFNYSKFHRGR